MKIYKRLGRIIFAFFYYIYDFSRYIVGAGWRNSHANRLERNYLAVTVYHSLEKSLSFKNRNPKSGTRNLKTLFDILNRNKNDYGFQEKIGLNVFDIFYTNLDQTQKEEMNLLRSRLPEKQINGGGISVFKGDYVKKGKLENPEEFFLTRYTLRSFSDQEINDDDLKRAIKLAMKTPSACNRQAWHIYDLKEKPIIEKALNIQNGNKGFGDNLKRLLVLTGDMQAFTSHRERNQHWIDGGLFSMSLIWALHSLGIASCCLNWSQGVKNDLALRKILDIKKQHSIIMLLAIGYPDNDASLCYSARRPIEEIYTLVKEET